jgi:pyruvate,orthophosphate dikinase
MVEASGVLTAEGSRTCHAALVARQLGRVAVVGCHGLAIDPARRELRLGGRVVPEGDMVSLDGTSGAVYAGMVDVERRRPTELLDIVASWTRDVAEPGLAMPAGKTT